MVYFAPHEIYSTSRCVSSTVGAIKQFAGPYNGFKPEGKYTRTKNFIFWNEKRLAARQRRILNAYKERSNSAGVGEGFILNAEEMATVWHFPVSESLKPSPAKTVESKKVGPPPNLPTEESLEPPVLKVKTSSENPEQENS